MGTTASADAVVVRAAAVLGLVWFGDALIYVVLPLHAESGAVVAPADAGDPFDEGADRAERAGRQPRHQQAHRDRQHRQADDGDAGAEPGEEGPLIGRVVGIGSDHGGLAAPSGHRTMAHEAQIMA